jgi:hypothetical protein
MSIRTDSHPLHDNDDSRRLSELTAACERASEGIAGRQALIRRLRAVLATLEYCATTLSSVPSQPPIEWLATDKSCDEYWSGYDAFAAGEPLTGWTDTPFAKGWFAAASNGSYAHLDRSFEAIP